MKKYNDLKVNCYRKLLNNFNEIITIILDENHITYQNSVRNFLEEVW